MKWFHRHKFDPEKWEQISHTTLTDKFWMGDDTPVGHVYTFSSFRTTT